MTTTSPGTDLSLRLRPEPAAAACVRRALAEGGLDADLDVNVSLLATELVTNSVRHAHHRGADLRVAAHLEPGFARVEVRDPGPGYDPEVRHAAAGYGLRLLDTLATRWGTKHNGGCTTWFEVDVRRRLRLAG